MEKDWETSLNPLDLYKENLEHVDFPVQTASQKQIHKTWNTCRFEMLKFYDHFTLTTLTMPVVTYDATSKQV